MPTHNTSIHLNPDDSTAVTALDLGHRVILRLVSSGVDLTGTRQQLTDLLRSGLTALYADSPTEPAIPETDPEPAPVTPLPAPGMFIDTEPPAPVSSTTEQVAAGVTALYANRYRFGLTQVEVGDDAS